MSQVHTSCVSDQAVQYLLITVLKPLAFNGDLLLMVGHRWLDMSQRSIKSNAQLRRWSLGLDRFFDCICYTLFSSVQLSLETAQTYLHIFPRGLLIIDNVKPDGVLRTNIVER